MYINIYVKELCPIVLIIAIVMLKETLYKLVVAIKYKIQESLLLENKKGFMKLLLLVFPFVKIQSHCNKNIKVFLDMEYKKL